jgi:UDP-N-acetylglucosamine 2-epimerase (non-hydrolysing)
LKKILSVVGARPNFMKVAPLHRAFLKYRGVIEHKIVHTGQHYDRAMSKIFFEDLVLPNPDFYLGVGSGSHAEQTAKIMIEFEKIVLAEKPDMIVVVGDVNSTMACSLVGVKLNVPVAHIEAGLRSGDRTMPEEINRIVTDSIVDLLFVSEVSGVRHLKREGVSEDKVFFVGNVMIDSLAFYREKSRRSAIIRNLNLEGKPFVLVTLHRPSNVDEKEKLTKILQAFEPLSQKAAIVFPVHPRTQKMIAEFGLQPHVDAIRGLQLIEPVGYLDFLALMERAKLVVTDSGGIQEETTFLGVPCLTLRKNTERPSTCDVGTNELCGDDVALTVRRGL